MRAFFVPLEITNRVFNTTLLNPASEDYQTTYKEVADLVRWITLDDDNRFSTTRAVATIEDSEFMSCNLQEVFIP